MTRFTPRYPIFNQLPSNGDPYDGTGTAWAARYVYVCRFSLQATAQGQPYDEQTLVIDQANSYIYKVSDPINNPINIQTVAQKVVSFNDQTYQQNGTPLMPTTRELEIVVIDSSYVVFHLEPPIPWQFQRSVAGMTMGIITTPDPVTHLCKYTQLNHWLSSSAAQPITNTGSDGCKLIYFEATTYPALAAPDPFTLYVEFNQSGGYTQMPYDPDIKNNGHKKGS